MIMMMMIMMMMMLMMKIMMMWLTMAANFQSASAAPDTSSSRILSVMTLISCTRRLVSCHVLSTLCGWSGPGQPRHVRQSFRSAEIYTVKYVAEIYTVKYVA